VIKRQVTEGQMVQAGMPLLEVADLSSVWVEADIYEYELPWVKVGQHARMTLTYLPGETFHGRVQYIYPFLKEATRTARVRLVFPNKGLKLKPDMFAQVEMISPLKEPAVVIPAEAVLDTGEKQHVFLALGQGRFEPRQVKVGVRGDDGQVQVLSGLKGGEEVVTSAQFLLDSESRFREAIAQMLKGGEAQEGKKEAAPPLPPTRRDIGIDQGGGLGSSGSPTLPPDPPPNPL
jgi:membrane fusion protein, copper/silver efflux system